MASSSSDGPFPPDYDGAWNGGIVPALVGGPRVSWIPDDVWTAGSVVLLVLDGLGWQAVRDHPERMPELAAMQGQAITTVVPSTTGPALTSIATGAPPAEHGVVGYRMRVGGQVLNVLKWDTDTGPDPEVVQPVPPFLGARIPSVVRSEFRASGFSGAQLRGTTQIGWRTTATLVEHCRRLVGADHHLVYAYYDGVDKVGHEYGPDSDFFRAELAAADRLVGDLRDALPPEAALLVTSDHGMVGVGPSAVVDLGPLHRYVSVYSGESRFRSLHARTGASGDLLAAAEDLLGDTAWVFSRERLFDEGWLGRSASATVRGRVGDVVLAARTLTAFADPTDQQEKSMLGRHGSLTPDEMQVPLLAARGRA